MVINCCPQIFKIAPSPAIVSALADVGAARLACYIGEHLSTPKVVDPRNPLVKLRLISLPRSAVVNVDRENVRDSYRLNVAFFARRSVFPLNVIPEGLLRR
jgi:hypothetical protein